MSDELTAKLIVVGSMASGKSCLLLRFVEQDFKSTTTTTIGVDFRSRTVEVRGNKIRLQIWDTAGQEGFQSVARGYYKEAAAAIIVYDTTSRASFAQLPKWLQAVRENAGNKELIVTLVGTKTDLTDKRRVTREEGEAFARERNLLFVEASAKTGEHVDVVFTSTAAAIARKVDQGLFSLDEPSHGVKRAEKRSVIPSTADATSLTTTATSEGGWCCS
jgi:Ras-related protein Rab-2A